MSKDELEAGGATLAFESLTGEVIDTEQRSDTYTSGSSRTIVIDGTGGGSGHVSSTVVVHRDIWMRTANGHERHVRLQADLPIRVGQRIAILSVRARKPSTRREVDAVTSVYAPSTDTFWTIRKLGDISTLLSLPKWSRMQIYGILLLWAAALGACFIAIGIPLVVVLAIVWWRRTQAHKKDAKQILAALEAEHRSLINIEHDAWRRDVERLRKPERSASPSIEAAQ